MSERRRPSLRAAVLAVLLLLGLVEVQSVVQTVRAQTRLRERVIRTLEGPVVATWPDIASTLRPGSEDAWQRALETLLARSPAAEAELLDVDGRSLAAFPGPAPVVHWPPAGRMQSILTGMISTWGPVAGEQPRLLTYAAFPSGGRTVVLRLAAPVPELIEDLRERRGLLIGHGLVLVLLAVAAGLILMPDTPSSPSSHGVEAYAEALGRLRDLGQALNEAHQIERDRLTGEMRDLEAMARAGELTSGMAHEVRNGLGTILGYARLIEQRQGAPDQAEPARRIREECETLETVVRRFMAFVRRETLHPAAFDLHAMLRRVVARESAAHPVAAANLVAPAELRLVGDEELLERAFENLVRNACEAAGERGHVRVDVGEAGAQVRVFVQDDGRGWPSGSEPFRPFASTKPGGLGLGLPLARKLVRLHGGDVVIGSSESGTRIEVALPTAAAPQRGET